MKRQNQLNTWVLAMVTAVAVGCGSDDKPETDTTGNEDESSSEGSETTSEPESSSGPADTSGPAPQPSNGDIGEPVLEEVPPETELSDLTDDQLAEVCAAYVKTSEAVEESLSQSCPVQSLFLAVQGEGVDDDESYQAACAEEFAACEAQLEESQGQTPEERCESAGECGASIKDFNDCNQQIAALDTVLLQPLTEQEVSECSETSLTTATNQAGIIGIQALLGITTVENQTGGSPTDPDGACQRIADACPDLGVALGAFAELGSLLQ
jgi:hypothetical protein